MKRLMDGTLDRLTANHKLPIGCRVEIHFEMLTIKASGFAGAPPLRG